MASSYSLSVQRNGFNSLKGDVQELVTYLETAKEKLVMVNTNIANNYSINGEVADKNRIDENIAKIDEVIGLLEGSITSAIAREVSRLNVKINDAKKKEEEERNKN